MNLALKRKWYKFSTIIGSCIILLTNGVFMIWGNMAVYALSYLLFNVPSASNLEAPWIVSLFIGFWMVGLLVNSSVARYLGIRWTALLGMFLTDLGFVASYFAVQISLPLLNITLGVITGLGTGLIQASALHILLQWAGEDIGFTVSFLQGSFYTGILVINQVVTAYINPENLLPDLKLGHSVYFTNTDIISRVPNSFLILAGLSVPCQLTGLFLMKDNTLDMQNHSDCSEILEEKSTDKLCAGYGSSPLTQDDVSSQNLEVTNQAVSNPTKTDLKQNVNDKDYSPKQAMRTASFYAMWTVFFLAEIPFLLLANYYKSFGQLWILDDHFLTNLGMTMAFLNIWMRVVWGVIMDKIGVRNCLSLEIILVITISMWYYFTAMVNRWLYFVVTVFLSSLTGAHYGACIYVVVLLYGKTHFSTNYGLLRSSAISINFIAPVLIEYILTSFGWFYVFSSAGFLNLLSLVLVFRFIPQ